MVKFSPAVRSGTKVMLGIAGPSSSGKTMSALRIARGLVGPSGKIALIDTENGRATHYADRFQFLHADFRAPFSPQAYLDALRAGVETEADVVIVDSMSHEHESQGGILEMHEAEMQRMAGDDLRKREKVKFSAWIKPKAEHNKLVNAILQMNSSFVFCFRAKDKLMMVKNAEGKQEPVSIGWQPICADRFEYECTGLLVLPPNSRGTPDLGAQASKVPAYLQDVFKPGEQLSERHGEALAAWARGGTQSAPPAIDATAALELAQEAASGGLDVLRIHWKGLSPEEKHILQPHIDALTAAAKQADAEAVQRELEPASNA